MRGTSSSAWSESSIAAAQRPTPRACRSARSPASPRLVDWVAEGSLDAAFVAIAGQIELPKGVTSRVVGVDRIGILAPGHM